MNVVAAVQCRQSEVCDLEHEATVNDAVGRAESAVGVDGRRMDEIHALKHVSRFEFANGLIL